MLRALRGCARCIACAFRCGRGKSLKVKADMEPLLCPRYCAEVGGSKLAGGGAGGGSKQHCSTEAAARQSCSTTNTRDSGEGLDELPRCLPGSHSLQADFCLRHHPARMEAAAHNQVALWNTAAHRLLCHPPAQAAQPAPSANVAGAAPPSGTSNSSCKPRQGSCALPRRRRQCLAAGHRACG